MPAISPFELDRTCPHPTHVGERTLPFTTENFYVRPSGSADYWCRECVRRYNREQRAARRTQGGSSRGRRFGVEIECMVDRDLLISELRARGLHVHDDVRYTHEVRAGQWKVVTDGSVYNGFELVSPPLQGTAGMADLKKACEALHAAGARVTQACGLHVHHDVSDLDTGSFGRLFRSWANAQHATDYLVAGSRRNSQWAQPLRILEVEHVEALTATDATTVRRHFAMADRYRSLNVACFPRYGTVEVRQHQGTTNFKKIAAWIAFGQAFIKAAKAGATTERPVNTDALLDRLGEHGGLTAANVTYLKGRAAHFGARPVVA